jgi:hypothetical protein
MDDLNGLDFSSNSSRAASKQSVTGTGNYYTNLRPASTAASSGRSTPLSAQASGAFKPPTAVAPKPSNTDSFSNLVSFGSAKSSNKLTLQEQQEKLQAEKAKKAEEQKKQYEAQFGHSNFWDGLGSKPLAPTHTPPVALRSSTPVTKIVSSGIESFHGSRDGQNVTTTAEDHDLFAAFNADTEVDNSSHYPPPNKSPSESYRPITSQRIDLTRPEAWGRSKGTSALADLGDDDDPFGLGRLETKKPVPIQNLATADDGDDFLGDLAKPVEEVKHQAGKSPPVPERQHSDEDQTDSDDPWDKAVNELVDMGFTAENSRRALTESGAGLDVQVAVGWLLNDAHRQAKEKAQSKGAPGTRSDRENLFSSKAAQRDTSGDRTRGEAIPAWMRAEGRSQSQPRRDDSRSPANSDSDITKTAAAVGSNLLKTANSFWKTSQKKVQKAVQELSQDSDPNQPKWMRDASSEQQQPRERQGLPEDKQRGRAEAVSSPSVTDEALMLEADSRPPPRKTKAAADPRFLASGSTSRDQSPAMSNPSTGRSTPVPRWQQTTPTTTSDPRTRISKQAIEEQSAQAYVSPARRKKVTSTPKPADEPDLLFGDSRSSPTQTSTPSEKPQLHPVNSKPQATKFSKPPTPVPVRPQAPPRNIPSLSPAALASSTQHRRAGTEHFKRGDYASAHSSYTSSLGSLAQGHPITIVLLCNRSLTALKTGDPKVAVSDADTALSLIGPGRGGNETIDLGDGAGDGKKPMQEYWGKALMRKAEALEQMERWKDAGAVWREAVEAGVGGATAIQGRQRCERALQPKPKPSPARPQAAKRPPKSRSALNDLAPASAQSTAAVKRLREANLAAEKADDEKFALADIVDARIAKWRDGRKDNLRALLGGLDQVLWEGSGWKKVGMHELVVNGKVKIIYMKAIARVHPDKVGPSFIFPLSF